MDSKNVIAAIALSSAVIVLYSLFFVPDQPIKKTNLVEKEKIEQIINHCKPRTLIIETFTKSYRQEIEPYGQHGMACADRDIKHPICIRSQLSRVDITQAIETTPMQLDKYWDYWPNGPNWPDGYMEEFKDDEHQNWVNGKHGQFVGVFKWVD